MAARTEREKVAHLLRRFGLGASETELDYYCDGGLKGAIDKLLSPEKIEETEIVDATAFGGKNNNLKPQSVRAWWIERILTTRRPLVEKMTLFWHDHFATSVKKVDNAGLMLAQNEILRENALGNFRTLLKEVSKDPAMMFWLDNQLNIKGKPNENFGREVMELFTLGIGHYSEKDVQEAARAFTGWNYSVRRGKKANPNSIKGGRPVFIENQEDHDPGIKTVLGKSGPFTGDDVLDILCDNVQTARNITTKVWTWFVYPEPDSATIERHVSAFVRSGLEVKALLRSIMESDEFYGDRSYRKLYKNPIDFTVSTLRQLGANVPVRLDEGGNLIPGPARALLATAQASEAMGMELLAPPDVSGWDGGPAWISTATMVERIRWADRIFGPPSAPQAVKGEKTKRTPTIGYQAAPLFESGDPLDVAKKLISVFDVELPEAKVRQVAEAVRRASGGTVTFQNANAAANAASRLIFGSPEFQFC